MKGKKEFRYIIRTRHSKKVIAEQNVVFGSEEKPFDEDWKSNPIHQMAIIEHKQKFLNEILVVDISENLSETEIKPMFTIDEIKAYILSQDSMGDILYNLSADKVKKANEIDEEE